MDPTPPYSLRTERLLLREFTPDDLDDVHAVDVAELLLLLLAAGRAQDLSDHLLLEDALRELHLLRVQLAQELASVLLVSLSARDAVLAVLLHLLRRLLRAREVFYFDNHGRTRHALVVHANFDELAVWAHAHLAVRGEAARNTQLERIVFCRIVYPVKGEEGLHVHLCVVLSPVETRHHVLCMCPMPRR